MTARLTAVLNDAWRRELRARCRPTTSPRVDVTITVDSEGCSLARMTDGERARTLMVLGHPTYLPESWRDDRGTVWHVCDEYPGYGAVLEPAS